MSMVRVLYVDDEPDIREVVELSLGLDPEFIVRSCSSGVEAIALAADWVPDLILLDVMMPEMDGPATLARLRNSPRTDGIPVVFMTSWAQLKDLEHFRELGAAGAIPKPFDPLTLATSVRRYILKMDARLAGPRARFLRRAGEDLIVLMRDRDGLSREDKASATLDNIITIAHRLAGGGGIVGYDEISSAALGLEKCAVAALSGHDTISNVESAFDRLKDAIEHIEMPHN